MDTEADTKAHSEAGAAGIEAWLTARGVPFTIHEHVAAQTVADAQERLPFPFTAYLKTVAFRLNPRTGQARKGMNAERMT